MRAGVRRWGIGAAVGVLAGGAAVGVGTAAAAFVEPAASPVSAVGAGVIRLVPEWLKELAVAAFGTGDKTALLTGIYLLLVLASVLLGRASLRRPVIGVLGVAAFGVIGVVAAVARPGSGPADPVPAVLAAAAGVLVLLALLRALGLRTGGDAAQPEPGEGPPEPEVGRRALLVGGGVAVGAAVVGFGGQAVSNARFTAVRSRATVTLPAPVSRANGAPGSDLRLAGLSPWQTPNTEFYRIDTALTVPQLSKDSWRLRLHGMLDKPRTIDYQQLLARPMIERDITLTCVSNEVGGDLAGNARWLGIRLADLLRECGVHPGADQIVARSSDGMTIGTPTSVVLDGRDALLAVGMNGEPLPVDHGFPVRMVVPGLYGYVSACKWLVDLELTTFAKYDAYWVERGWAQQAPIKTASRIDTPRDGRDVKAGTVPVAGVAWAQHRGIREVQVSVDGGDWHTAELAPAASTDTWRQWVYRWPATAGRHQLRVRATDGTGAVQTADTADPLPDGATGYHSVSVTVR